MKFLNKNRPGRLPMGGKVDNVCKLCSYVVLTCPETEAREMYRVQEQQQEKKKGNNIDKVNITVSIGFGK